MDPEFWNGRRVVVTGHTGFKGSWLSLVLAGVGAEVTGYALAPPTDPAMFVLARVEEVLAAHHVADIRDAVTVCDAIVAADPEIIIHMAAQPLVIDSYTDPVGTFDTNVMGLVNVFEAARQVEGLLACVNVTTDKCYENREEDHAYTEDEAMGGHDPYSASKGCAELVTASYRRSFFHDVNGAALASARAGNVIGGGDWAANRLVPDMINAFIAGEPVRIRSPRSVRPWQHVLEPLSGYIALAEAAAKDRSFASGWNFGPDRQDMHPVETVVEVLRAAWGVGASWELDADPSFHEAALLMLDNTKAREQLGWTPRLTLEDALAWTAEWYRVFAAEGDLRAVSETQIARFFG